MLRSQKSLLEPRPSDRLRVGDCLVDLSLREIAPIDASASPLRVTLKSIGVLSVLIAHQGKLVSREALLEWVWPDTMPTDDVVTQAIAQLRKSFSDDHEHPRYIDTLAKQGYRLIAAIEWLEEPETRRVEPESESESESKIELKFQSKLEPQSIFDRTAANPSLAVSELRRAPSASTPDDITPRYDNDIARLPRIFDVRALSVKLPAHLLASTAVVVFFFALARLDAYRAPSPAASPRPAPVPLRPIPIRRIVSLPSRESEPSLSPDGAQVAYSRYPENADAAVLMVQTTAAVMPRALTTPTPGQWDVWPSWSPDGRQIAFLRMDRERCRVMLLPSTGGATRDLAECRDNNFPLAWYPDGHALVGVGATQEDAENSGRALFRLDVASGTWSPIAYDRSPEDIDVWPKVSPDGRWIAFQRNLSLGDLWRMPVAGGAPERLTSLRANFFGLAWTPDSDGVVFSRSGPDGVVLSMLEIDGRRIRDYVPDDWALKQPVVAGSTVAFVIEDSRSSLRRLSVQEGHDTNGGITDSDEAAEGEDNSDGERAFADAEPLFTSTRSEIMPSIAPDGRQLFFVSDRDGDVRLWWVDQTQPDHMRAIDDLTPVLRYPAVWNADASRALVLGEDAGDNGESDTDAHNANSNVERHGAGGSAIYEVDPGSGRAVRLPVPDRMPVHAAYHPDPNRLLVVVEREQGRLGLVLYDRSRTPWRPLAEISDVVMAVTDHANRRVIFVRTYKPGIWQADLNLSAPREIDRVGLQSRIRTVVAAADGAWFLDARPNCRWYWRRLAEPSTTEGRCLGNGPVMPQGLSYDSVRRKLYASIPDEAGRDIGVLPLRAFGIAGDAIARRD